MSVPPTCRQLAPAPKLVCFALRRDGPLTWAELRTKTQLPDSTLADALDTLQSEGVIRLDSAFSPLSKMKYQLANSDIRSSDNG